MRFLSLSISCLLLYYLLSACSQPRAELTNLKQDPHIQVYFNHK